MRFLKLRVIVNGTFIYAIRQNQPLVIPAPTNPTKIVVTDGFHITKPLELTYTTNRTYYFQVVCAIENAQLVAGIIVTLVIYAMGLTSGILFLKLLSLMPIVYFLFLYYINRKEFIQVRPA